MKYCYENSMKEEAQDEIEWILSKNPHFAEALAKNTKDDDVLEFIWKELRTRGSVTGDVSDDRYYWEKDAQAISSIRHNEDLLEKALSDYGETMDDVKKNGVRWADFRIRVYLLPSIINSALEEITTSIE